MQKKEKIEYIEFKLGQKKKKKSKVFRKKVYIKKYINGIIKNN